MSTREDTDRQSDEHIDLTTSSLTAPDQTVPDVDLPLTPEPDPANPSASAAGTTSSEAGTPRQDPGSGGTPEPLIARLGRGAVSGVVAGLVFLLLNVWYAVSTGGAATQPLDLMSSLVLGADALPGEANALLGFVVHIGISALFGMTFGLFAPAFRNNGAIALAGGLYGIGLFVINFLILANTLVPQFTNPNLPVEFMAHIVFGHLLALGFYSSGARSHLRRFPLGRSTGLRDKSAT